MSPADAPLPQIDKEKIRAHVKYLSSDELEGRGQGSAAATWPQITSGNNSLRMD